MADDEPPRKSHFDCYAKKMGGDAVETVLRETAKPEEFKYIWLKKNLLTIVPLGVYRYTSICILDLSNNPLLHLSEDISRLQSLEGLAICKCGLNMLPDSLGSLVNLTFLFAARNKLTFMPDSFTALSKMCRLDMGSNRLVNAPWIKHMTFLTHLKLSNNLIKCLPSAVTSLAKLVSIKLRNNSGLGHFAADARNEEDCQLLLQEIGQHFVRHENCKKVVIEVLAIRKFAESVLNVIQKDVVRLICVWLWLSRNDDEWEFL